MAQSAIQAAIQQICQEKNLSEESVLRTVELALAAAFRKDFGNKMQNIVTEFDSKTGAVQVFDLKTAVEDLPAEVLAAIAAEEEERLKEIAESRATGKKFAGVSTDAAEKNFGGRREKAAFVSEEAGEDEELKKFNPKTEIQLQDAKLIDAKYEIGDEIKTPLEVPGEFGRMAAQTAKQVIIQKIREQERQNIYDEYKMFEGQVINGTIQRREGRLVLVDLGRATAVMPMEEQVERERYNVGNRMKFYLKIVDQTTRGPQLVVSRVSTEIVKKIFEMEIPEVANNIVEIKAVAREAGNRSKVAIYTADESVDPIGACVGQRGTRIQTIISELGNEKIDIVLWDEDQAKFITNSLSPAKVLSVELRYSDEKQNRTAIVKVKDDQLSLAIGKAGQNVRLASKLAGWKIDIVSESGGKVRPEPKEAAVAETPAVPPDETEQA